MSSTTTCHTLQLHPTWSFVEMTSFQIEHLAIFIFSSQGQDPTGATPTHTKPHYKKKIDDVPTLHEKSRQRELAPALPCSAARPKEFPRVLHACRTCTSTRRSVRLANGKHSKVSVLTRDQTWGKSLLPCPPASPAVALGRPSPATCPSPLAQCGSFTLGRLTSCRPSIDPSARR